MRSEREIQVFLDRITEIARSMGMKPDAEKITVEIVPDEQIEGLQGYNLPGGKVLISETTAKAEKGMFEVMLLHEAAHALVPGGKHDEKWAEVFLRAVNDWDPKRTDNLAAATEAKYADEGANALAVYERIANEGRHSTGGSLMTFQEAVERLVDAGWEEGTARIILNQEMGVSGRVDEALVNRIISDPPSDRDAPAGDPVPDQVDRQNEADRNQIRQAAEDQAAGLPLSAEQQELLEEGDNYELFLQDLRAIVQEQGVNFSWVYNDPNMQLTPGSLDNNEAMIELYGYLVEHGAMEELPADIPEDELVATVQEFLAQNPGNAIVRYAVQEWGQDTNNYIPTREVDGVKEADIFALMDQGFSRARAITIGKIARDNELTPQQLAEIWGPIQAKTEKMAGVMTQVGGPMMNTPMVQTRGIAQVAKRFKEGLDMYDGSRVLATIYVSDQGLAEKLRNDPWSLDSGELQRAIELLGGQEGAEQKSGDPQVAWLLNRAAGMYKTTVSVDKTAIEDSVRTLADAWNLSGFEDVAASVAREIMGSAIARARAQLPNPFGPVEDPVTAIDSAEDAIAHAKERFRRTGEYRELFGSLTPGESEEEYVARFESQSQRILGDDNVSVVRNAMRSGNVNSVYQQALLTDAGDASTRFQEILARNAAVFREML